MAGIIPKKSSSGRKQWSIQGSQRSSLKRLRSQLASDGCPESQVVLAKQLLDEECEFKSEQKENARLGVYWLLKASEQGNVEANELLKLCLKTGKGITEYNYMDVKACVSTTQDEKIVRRAAKEVFASLSNGEEYITSNQLQKRILAIDQDQSLSKTTRESEDTSGDANGEIINNFEEFSDSEEELDWSQISDVSNEKLTEDKVVSAAVTFSHGLLPTVNNVICLSEPNLRALDHVPFVHWSILYPVLSLKILYLKLIKYLGNQSIPLPLARTELQVLALFLMYSLVSFDNVAYFLPTVIFYVSFIIMVITTLQLLQTQRELHDFRLWRGLFICYSNGDLNEYSFETQFILSHTKQYAWFFFGLLAHYFVYSLTPVKLDSEFAVMSCCLMFMTLFGFMPKRRSKTVFDPLVFLSFCINVLARYPYDTDSIVSKGWRYLDLNFPNFPSYIVGNGIEFCISFRLVFYVLIPVILLRMAMKETWRGSYRTVLPHLVTLSWLQYFALCSHNATMYGMYRATLALVGSVMFLPLVGIMTVVLPAAAVTQWIVTSNLTYTICMFLFLVVVYFIVCFLCAKTRYAGYVAAAQVMFTLVAFFALISSHSQDKDMFAMKAEPKALEWDAFQKLCHQKLWEGTETTANAQVRCAELESTRIFWEGVVTSVNLVSVTNSYRYVIDRFPQRIADYLYCLFGSKQTCYQDEEGQVSDCAVLQGSLRSSCTLKEFNIYTFEVIVQMPSSFWRFMPQVHLHLTNEFRNFTLRIKPKDLIWFKGALFNNHSVGNGGILGSLNTYVRGDEIGCISCSDFELGSFKLYQSVFFSVKYLHKLYDGFKFILNVMFSPVIMIK